MKLSRIEHHPKVQLETRLKRKKYEHALVMIRMRKDQAIS